METPIKIASQPGVKRDGTVLEGESYIDAQWCRFQKGKPRKILGYQSLTGGVPDLTYGLGSFSTGGLNYIHAGSESDIQQYQVTNVGGLALQVDRTPGAFVSDPFNVAQVDHFFDAVAVLTDVIVHSAPNLDDIDSNVNSTIWLGPVDGIAPLVDSTLPTVSGGIVTIGPYLFSFGNNGRIGWSVVNDPTTLDSEAFITQQKIVKGLPLRGSGGGPAGIFWSLDSLIRATFVGGAAVWQFDTLSADLSILSSRGVIEYDGIFYWTAVDRFMMFNGVTREVPNQMNLDYFFNNLNFAQRQKIFAIKVPRFGEIWWCYPRGSATECTHAIIYNVREGTWYDTTLPGDGRSDGIYAKVYNKPFMFDVKRTVVPGGFTLWQHETGVDEVVGVATNAIQSFFETKELTMLDAEQPSSNSLRVARVEPDFVQLGPLTLSVKGRPNAKATVVAGTPHTILQTPLTSEDETVKMKDIRRLMSFKFESNVGGGYYEMGDTYAHVEPADGRIES